MHRRRPLASFLAAVLLLPLLVTGEVVAAPGAHADDASLQVRDLAAEPSLDAIELTWRAPDHASATQITAYRFDVVASGTQASVHGYPVEVTTDQLRAGDDPAPDPEDPDDRGPDLRDDPLLYGVVLASLTTGTAYGVSVTPVSVDDPGWQPSTVTATPRSAPASPTDLVLTPGETSITATWEAPTLDVGLPLTGYRVTVFGADHPATFTTDTTTLELTGLERETGYTVVVVALNERGESAAAVARVRTLAAVGVARLGGVAATTVGSTTTLRASVIDDGRPTTLHRSGFVYSRTDPPVLDAAGSLFVEAPPQGRTLTATVTDLGGEQLWFVRAVLDATYPDGRAVSYGPVVPYSVTDRTIRFTNAGASGSQGPTQEQVNGFYSTGQGGSFEHRVEVRAGERGIQRYLVDLGGAYRIEAAGAGGGSGARGAVVNGTFSLVEGQELLVAVGQRAAQQTGGGGGTFVTTGTELADAEPLLVAGGGAGQGLGGFQARSHGRAPDAGELESPGQDGGALSCGSWSITCNSAAGRTGGFGGRVQEPRGGSFLWNTFTVGAGGGFLTDGVDGYHEARNASSNAVRIGTGGRAFHNGAAGGWWQIRVQFQGLVTYEGGFGGGGAGTNQNRPGGGGGGYNGGGGGVLDAIGYYSTGAQRDIATYGGGGGSFNAGAAPDAITGAGANAGPGYVEMRLLATAPSAGPTTVTGVRAGQQATFSSEVLTSGGDLNVQRGFLLSQTPDATFETDGVVVLPAGQGTGIFTASSPTLPPRDFLFVRSYAQGFGGTDYGPLATFATFRPFEFTTAGQQGADGPTQAQLNTAYAGTPLAGRVITGADGVPTGIQRFEVPVTGRYRIQALGARGGVSTPAGFDSPQGGDRGGRGAAVEATFDLQQGDELLVLVGQQPDNPVGGGGGSFVVRGSSPGDEPLEPLLVAGGGGAVSFPFDTDPRLADATAPVAPASASATGSEPGSGGTEGNGGRTTAEAPGGGGGVGGGGGMFGGVAAPGDAELVGLAAMGGGGGRAAHAWSGAGGGLFTDGEDGQDIVLASGTVLTVVAGSGGRAFVNGGRGGVGVPCEGSGASTAGGFGGGGAGSGAYRGNCWAQGGNGGGYNGAGAVEPTAADQYPRIGRGAGSFNTGDLRTDLPGVNLGDGRVTVTLIPAPAPNALFPAEGEQPRELTDPAGTTIEREAGSVLLVLGGGTVRQLVTSTPASTTLAATRSFVDTQAGETDLGVQLDVVENGDGDGEVLGLLERSDDADELLPVAAEALAGVTSDGVSMLLAGVDDQDRSQPVGQSGEPTTSEGGRIATVGQGLPAGVEVEVSVRSEPQLLGRFTVDDVGRFAWQVRMPEGLEPGTHTLVLATVDGTPTAQQRVLTVGICVGGGCPPRQSPPPPPPSTGGGALPPSQEPTAPPSTSTPPPVTAVPAPGGAGATVGGTPVEVRVERTSPTRTVVGGDGFTLELDTSNDGGGAGSGGSDGSGGGSDGSGGSGGSDGGSGGSGGDDDVAAASDLGVLLPRGGGTRLGLRGFAGGSPVAVWLRSEPVLLGSFNTDDDGVLEVSELTIPDEVSACPHTLQVVGELPSGDQVAVSLRVWVDAASPPYRDLAGSMWQRHATCMAERAITVGHVDGTYRPSATVSRQAAVAWLYRVAGSPAVAVNGPVFSDVGADHLFAAPIAWAVQTGLVAGYPDGSFRPTAPVSRGAFATMLYRSVGEPAVPGSDEGGFRDVAGGQVFATEIAWAAQAGVVRGYDDGTFRPWVTIRRGPGAAMIVRAHPS